MPFLNEMKLKINFNKGSLALCPSLSSVQRDKKKSALSIRAFQRFRFQVGEI